LLLLDTHILVWTVARDRRLTTAQRAAIEDPEHALLVSAVVAYELTHLQAAGRIPIPEPLSAMQDLIGFEIVDLPGQCWQEVASLPTIHGDPIDRMLVAHARIAGATIVTADRAIKRYPVPVI
jgi:PIN domain nuclease of toxin-antitoxin system